MHPEFDHFAEMQDIQFAAVDTKCERLRIRQVELKLAYGRLTNCKEELWAQLDYLRSPRRRSWRSCVGFLKPRVVCPLMRVNPAAEAQSPASLQYQ